MKAIGSGSLSSVLTVIVDMIWWGMAIVLAITVVLMLVGSKFGLWVDAAGPSIEAGPNAAMSIPVAFSMSREQRRVAAPALGIDDAQLRELHGALRFPPQRGAFFAANLAIVVGALALGMWVLAQLRGVFLTLRDGRPFVSANAVRVQRIGWAVIAGELARAAIVFFESSYASAHFVAAGITFVARPQVNAFAIFNGLIILVIAEVFREGTRLEEDRSLTI